MKSFLLSFLCIFPLVTFGQDFNETLNDIRESEAKSALRAMSIQANLNTGDYDVKYHRLEFDVDPSSAFLSGEVTTYFEAKSNLSTVTFDLSDNMLVSQILQRGIPLAFTQNTNDELIITLPTIQNTGVLDSLTITYSGNPISSGFGSYEQTTHNGDPIIWTLSEPYGAKGWWPCKQDLNDKIDNIDVYIKTPQYNPSNEAYVAVSNGLEQSQTNVGTDKITHFKHTYPIPAYLIAMAVTNYEVYSHTVANNGNPFDIVNYVYPENLTSAQNSTGVTVDIMNLFTNLFEEYPYAEEKYGHAQFGWGGGMEHTTVSFMGSFNRNLIAHELAHQWFGDKITCGSWKDIWLNEGFATYLSGLVIENLDGNTDFTTWKQQLNSSITALPNGAVYLSNTDTLSVNRIFSSRLTYNKGAMVLHMLRKKLGDLVFFEALQTYLIDPDHAYDYALTEDFITIVETESGEDLTEFFDDWLYNEGYPSYTVSLSQPSATSVSIQLTQTQSDASVSFFEAPVPVRLIGAGGEQLDVVLNNTINNQVFTEAVTFNVVNVIFDPESDLISKSNTVTLGLDDFDISTQISLFPNPSKGELFIQKPEAISISQINVYNALGQLLLQQNNSETLDVSNFSNGMLFVKLQTNQGIIVKTVIKN
ncbi:M1 family aminopeptidase [Lacinutrix undariae]